MYTARLIFARGKIRGSSLLIALIVLLAFAITVLAGSHLLLSEQKISTNQNDRRFAFQVAELALRQGELNIANIESDKNSLQINHKIYDLKGAGLFGDGGVFTAECKPNPNLYPNVRGLCLSADQASKLPNPLKLQPAWNRSVSSGVSMLDPTGNNFTYLYEKNPGKKVWQNPRYIIELIDYQSLNNPPSILAEEGHLYRITARAWGLNKNTQVTLQSFFSCRML